MRLTYTQLREMFPLYLWAISVVKHPEDDPGQGVRSRGMVRRRDHRWQVVLQSLAQDRVEGQVGAHDVLLDPHVAAKTLDLLPQAIQILKEYCRLDTVLNSSH